MRHGREGVGRVIWEQGGAEWIPVDQLLAFVYVKY